MKPLGRRFQYLIQDFPHNQPDKVWEMLHTKYGRIYTAARMAISWKMQMYTWKKGVSVDDFIGGYFELVSAFLAAGGRTNDEEIFQYLVTALPSNFHVMGQARS